MRRFITTSENCKCLVFDKNPNRAANSVTREKSLVDDFYKVELDSSELACKVEFYRDPIYELFNQQRLSQIGVSNVETWIKSMMSISNNPLSELRQHCSDSDLLSVMKSRYLQTPSEVMNWARYLNDNLSELKKEVSLAREREEELKKQDELKKQAESSTNVVAVDGATTSTNV